MSLKKGSVRSQEVRDKISATIRRKSALRDVDRYRVDADGCWIWKLHVMANGYGQMTKRNGGKLRTNTAHRYFYEKYKGTIPQGLEVHHTCFKRNCVNPSHLEAVTREYNRQQKQQRFTLNEVKSICCQNCIEKLIELKSPQI